MLLPAELPNLVPWQTFYEIIGSSSGALVGLQFIAIALIANTRTRADFRAINAFGTPNVVHFSGALTIAAIISAPWPSNMSAAIGMSICGIFGLGYSAKVFHRASRPMWYKPVLEDWIWYAIVPCVIYVVLTIGAVLLRTGSETAHFIVAGAALGLLMVGIRNVWDSVTHIVTGGSDDAEKKPE